VHGAGGCLGGLDFGAWRVEAQLHLHGRLGVMFISVGCLGGLDFGAWRVEAQLHLHGRLGVMFISVGCFKTIFINCGI